MHTLITYASAPGPRCQDALSRIELRHLAALLQRLSPVSTLQGKATDLTPVHERALADAAGLDGPDGLIPWAAREAQGLGLTELHGAQGWAWITPCHWTVHADHVDMADPLQLGLTAKDSDALREAMQPYFAEDGITLFARGHGQSHTRWLAHGPVFSDLPTASLDRVAGQTVDAWMPRQPQAKPLRRLQNEMQMLLYTHSVNDQRSQFHLSPVNAFWVSGTGTPTDSRPAKSAHECSVRDALRPPALHDDAAAWVTAWHALDAATLAHDEQRLQKGEPVQLTLCGENQAITLAEIPLGLWERLRRWVLPVQVGALLKTL
jgi:hypothetical protein